MENSKQPEEKVQKIDPNQKQDLQPLEEEHGLWAMDFDGALGKYGVGIGIWIRSLHHQQGKLPWNVRLFSYKLAFDCTNNEVLEYKALITCFLKDWVHKKFLCMVIQNL